ncbi:MAG TPA: CbbQ/NirQ/NorQ C-terminal domain-containing protein, partial [Acidiferrobacteraceae bacterium]|nr:CbbQ/NirQ/NorQ C-terminal domain-containing protein [Acidiferrobacteraceae bacterium]
QTVLKDLKPSTKQRFVAIPFDYASEELERRIVHSEAGLADAALVERIVAAGRKCRSLKEHGLQEATSTRALVYAASLIAAGIKPLEACDAALIHPLTDDRELAEAMREIVQSHLAST